MKKAVSIFAVLVMTIGMFSCEAETNLEETDAVYDINVNAATDGEDLRTERRDG